MNNFEIDDIEETIKAASNNLSMSCITIEDLEQCYQQLYKKKPPHYYFTKQIQWQIFIDLTYISC